MPRKDRNFWESARYNSVQFMQYFNRLTELAISMFKWENVPDTIDVRFLELALFGDGKALFFKDDVIGYVALRCTTGGMWSVYNVPSERRAYASNGYQNFLTDENSVIIYNNMLHTNSTLEIENFSRRLWDLDRTIDVNVKAQKTPVLIRCDETQRLTMKNLYMKFEGNEPFIFGDKNLDPNSIKVLTTEAPYISDKLQTLKMQIWNEALTYLGISNTNSQKKERMLSDEVLRNLGGTIASRYSRLESRRSACDQINKMFGLNIECNFREDFREMDDEIMFAGETAGKGGSDFSTLAVDLRTK